MHANQPQTKSPNVPLDPANSDLLVKKWLLSTFRGLVDHPEAVILGDIPTHNGALFELSCAKDDVRKVIGKGGKTAESIRNLMSCFSGRSGRKYRLDIIED